MRTRQCTIFVSAYKVCIGCSRGSWVAYLCGTIRFNIVDPLKIINLFHRFSETTVTGGGLCDDHYTTRVNIGVGENLDAFRIIVIPIRNIYLPAT